MISCVVGNVVLRARFKTHVFRKKVLTPKREYKDDFSSANLTRDCENWWGLIVKTFDFL
jgi:hypothetical protein